MIVSNRADDTFFFSKRSPGRRQSLEASQVREGWQMASGVTFQLLYSLDRKFWKGMETHGYPYKLTKDAGLSFPRKKMSGQPLRRLWKWSGVRVHTHQPANLKGIQHEVLCFTAFTLLRCQLHNNAEQFSSSFFFSRVYYSNYLHRGPVFLSIRFNLIARVPQ